MDRQGHDPDREQFWGQFLHASERFDAAYFVEELGDLIVPLIPQPLLRREVDIATDTVARSLGRPADAELAEQAAATAIRLIATLDRISERSTSNTGTVEALVMSHALSGRYATAAAVAEPFVGPSRLLRLFLTALRLHRFDIPLTLRLLSHGRPVEDAIWAGTLVGRYGWWPAWLLKIISERAVAGTLDEETVGALENCAYASLTPVQANLARKLLGGDSRLIANAAQRLEGLGHPDAADRLRHGDLNTVALATRLMMT